MVRVVTARRELSVSPSLSIGSWDGPDQPLVPTAIASVSLQDFTMSTAVGSAPDRLAVYGTLRPAASAWPLLEPLVEVHEGSCLLPGTLYDTGLGYPAYRPGDGPGVPADVVRLRDTATALPVLDGYEGDEYRRTLCHVDGAACWIYVWIEPVDGMRVLPHGWRS